MTRLISLAIIGSVFSIPQLAVAQTLQERILSENLAASSIIREAKQQQQETLAKLEHQYNSANIAITLLEDASIDISWIDARLTRARERLEARHQGVQIPRKEVIQLKEQIREFELWKKLAAMQDEDLKSSAMTFYTQLRDELAQEKEDTAVRFERETARLMDRHAQSRSAYTEWIAKHLKHRQALAAGLHVDSHVVEYIESLQSTATWLDTNNQAVLSTVITLELDSPPANQTALGSLEGVCPIISRTNTELTCRAGHYRVTIRSDSGELPATLELAKTLPTLVNLRALAVVELPTEENQ